VVIILAYLSLKLGSSRLMSGSGRLIRIIERVPLSGKSYLCIALIDSKPYVIGSTEEKVEILMELPVESLEKLKQALATGRKYDLIEVVACPGGCVHGAGLPFNQSRDEIRNRVKQVYQADDTEAISLPCKSPACINLYEKLLKENTDLDTKMFHTHFERRNVLL
jgi:hypothetical protein